MCETYSPMYDSSIVAHRVYISTSAYLRHMLTSALLVCLFASVGGVVPGISRPSPIRLLQKDVESLNCLFFRRNCTDHLVDLSAANRLFFRVGNEMSFRACLIRISLDILEILPKCSAIKSLHIPFIYI